MCDRSQEFISIEGSINTQDLHLIKRQRNPWRKKTILTSMNTLRQIFKLHIASERSGKKEGWSAKRIMSV